MIYFFSVFKDNILFQHIFDVCWQILFLHICIFKNFFGLIIDHSQTSIKNLQTVRCLNLLDCFGLFFFSCFCYIISLLRSITNLYPIQSIFIISNKCIYWSRRATTLNYDCFAKLTLFPNNSLFCAIIYRFIDIL